MADTGRGIPGPDQPSAGAPGVGDGQSGGHGGGDPTRRLPRPESAPTSAGVSGAGSTRPVRRRESTCADYHTPRALGYLEPGTELFDNYQVEQTLQPHESRQPGLYLCTNPSGRLVLKVAAAESLPAPELWSKLAELRHPNILRIDRCYCPHGYHVEVQEYCAGGSLAEHLGLSEGGLQVPAGWFRDHFIPQVVAALAYLHGQGVVHRDLKPANILARDESLQELVIGDFDVSTELAANQTSRLTERIGATWAYLAPESFMRPTDDSGEHYGVRVTRPMDFYALGITTLELLCGTTAFHEAQLPELFDFHMRGSQVRIPDWISEDLRLLIAGLLVRRPELRWGPEEVDRWLRAATTDEDRARMRTDAAAAARRLTSPYRLGTREATTPDELARAIEAEKALATEDLLKSDALLGWITALDSNLGREVRRAREEHRENPQLAVLACQLLCDPHHPLRLVTGHDIHSPPAWVDIAMRAARPEAHSLVTPSELRRLAYWCAHKAGPERALASAIRAIPDWDAPRSDRGPGSNDVVLAEVAWLLDPERPIEVTTGHVAGTPQEFALLAYGHPPDWTSDPLPDLYVRCRRYWEEGYLEAWLRQRAPAIAAQAAAVRRKLEGHPAAAFERVLRLLEPTLPSVKVVLETKRLAEGCHLPFGTQRRFQVDYTTIGPGIPFAGVDVAGAHAEGISIASPIIDARRGTLEIVIDGRDVPVSPLARGSLTLTGEGVVLVGKSVPFEYQVHYPVGRTVTRAFVAGSVGAVLMSLPRAAMEKALGTPELPDPLSGIFERTVDGQFPGYQYILGGFALAAAVAVVAIAAPPAIKVLTRRG